VPLLILPQGPGIPVLDVAGLITELYPYLGAQGESDLFFWTAADLYSAANEAAERLAVQCPVWVERQNMGVAAAALTLPERCLRCCMRPQAALRCGKRRLRTWTHWTRTGRAR
jgi:hypothetical protein